MGNRQQTDHGPKCDISVSNLFHFLDSFGCCIKRVWEFGIEKSIGFDIGKHLVSGKVSDSVSFRCWVLSHTATDWPQTHNKRDNGQTTDRQRTDNTRTTDNGCITDRQQTNIKQTTDGHSTDNEQTIYGQLTDN